MNSYQKTNERWRNFLTFCSKLESTEQFEHFFELFLTISERHELVARYEIVKELIKEEKTQRQIAEILGLSTAKITRGSNQLKTIDKKFEKFVKDNMI